MNNKNKKGKRKMKLDIVDESKEIVHASAIKVKGNNKVIASELDKETPENADEIINKNILDEN